MDEHEPSLLGSFLLEPADEETSAGSGPSATPRSRFRLVRNVILVVLLATVIVVGVLFGPTALQLLREKNTTIDTPPRVAGLARDDTANDSAGLDYLKSGMSAGAPVDHTVAAVYAPDGDGAHNVLFIGGTGLMLHPDKALDSMFRLVSDQSDGVESVRSEPAGPLGGILRCGTTRIDQTTVAVCGWADHGCIAIAMFAGRDVPESADMFLRMRTAMQHRH
jgi:hypothetical protein